MDCLPGPDELYMVFDAIGLRNKQKKRKQEQ